MLFNRDLTDKTKRLFEVLEADDNAQLITTESCTGGLLAGLITSIPGSSTVLEHGYVVYSNGSKKSLLGVPARILDDFGAVSAETADYMVTGALNSAALADRAVSITGIAGPGGGTKEKPVGLVYIGIKKRGRESHVTECHFNGDRETIRLKTIDKALDLMIETGV